MVKEKNELKWYVIKTQSNKERSVVERLNIETSRSSLGDKIGRILIPTEKEFQIKEGKRVSKEKIVYPGYVFIQTKALGELTMALKGINGCSGFLKDKDGNPSIMKNADVSKMLKEQDVVDNIETQTAAFLVNEEVKIIDGPFSSFKGNVESIDNNKQKLKISVSIFGKKTILDMSLMQVEKIEQNG